MGSQKVSGDDLPIGQSSVDTTFISQTGKIKRPPNAFMLFAKENRKKLAIKHPGIMNKEISTILGKMWKDAPGKEKEKFYRNANVLEGMHKRLYPGYYYSPREARLKKTAKMKKKANTSSTLLGKDKKDTMITNHVRVPVEDEKIICNYVSISSSSYIPNNPDYLIHLGPEMIVHGNKEAAASSDSASQNQSTNSSLHEDTALERRNGSESVACKNRPSCSRKDPSHFPGDVRYFYRASPACCSSTEHNPRCINPFVCKSTQNAPALCCPYWSSAQEVHHPFCYQGRDDKHKDMKQFIPTMRHPMTYCRHPAECFNRSNLPYYKDSGVVQYPEFNRDMTHLQESEYDYKIINPETGECFRKSREKGRLSSPLQRNYYYEDKICAQNTLLLEPSYQRTGYLPSHIQPEHREGIRSYSSYEPSTSKVIRNEQENIDRSKFYDESDAGEHVNSSHRNFNYNNPPETSAQNSSSYFRDNRSIMPQSSRNLHIPNNEFSKRQNLVSQPAQGNFEIYNGVLPPHSQMLGVNEQSIKVPFQQPYDLGLGKESSESNQKAEASSTSNIGEQNTLVIDMQRSSSFQPTVQSSHQASTFNSSVSYAVRPETSDGQINIMT